MPADLRERLGSIRGGLTGVITVCMARVSDGRRRDRTDEQPRCRHCARLLVGRRSNTVWCSDACRKKAARRQRGGAERKQAALSRLRAVEAELHQMQTELLVESEAVIERLRERVARLEADNDRLRRRAVEEDRRALRRGAWR